jgi:hypothetical protein
MLALKEAATESAATFSDIKQSKTLDIQVGFEDSLGIS